MAVVTFNGTPSEHVNEALRKIVNDLTGYIYDANTDDSTEYMRLVYPATLDTSYGSADFVDLNPDNTAKGMTIILESTEAMDPYARPTLSEEGSQFDPWRICFQTHDFKKSPVYDNTNQEVKMDESTSLSMAIYVGSPTTLWVSQDQQSVKIAWKQILGNNLKFDWSSTGDFQASYLALKRADFVEPLGHVGGEWTHNFDPVTTIDDKFGDNTPDMPTDYSDTTQAYVFPGDGPNVSDPTQLFINRYNNNTTVPDIFGVVGSTRNSNPVIYKMVLTDHGLFLGTWGENPEETGDGFSWMVVQRAVNKDTGITRGLPAPVSGSLGNRPLFCVCSVGNEFYKFVVREHDLDIPSAKKNAAVNTEDSAAVLNPYQQQSLTENGEYVVTFINNLNSSRFRYSDELDMVGTVSADVIGGGTTIQVNVYGEDENRTYSAMWPSKIAPLVFSDEVTTTSDTLTVNTTFTGTSKDGNDVKVYVNNVLVNPSRYTVTYNTATTTPGKITFDRTIAKNSVVRIEGYGDGGGAFGTGMRIVVVEDIPTPNTP